MSGGRAPKIGVIGGSSFLESDYCKGMRQEVWTPGAGVEGVSGPVRLWFDDAGPTGLVFCQRHEQIRGDGATEYRQPHLIDHVRNVTALKEQGCTHVVLFCSVGSMRPDIGPGSIVIIDDYVSLSTGTQSRYTDKRSHVAPALGDALRRSLVELVADVLPDSPLLTSGAYVMTRGPRFETKAEIRHLAQLGDVVGMTAAHEITLCCEQPAVPVAAICCVDNMANGVGSAEQLSYEYFRACVAENVAKLERLLEQLGRRQLSF